MFRSLRIRNFRLFSVGQAVSQSGAWMQRVAQDWLVLQLTNSGTALGIVTAIQFLPPLLLGLLGGAVADRGDKRVVLLITQSGLALAALTLGVLDVTGVVELWHVYAMAAVVGVITAFDTPTRQAFVVEMVGRDDLVNAVGISSTIFSGGRIVGPAIAGVLINAVGTGWAFIANALSSLGVIVALALMRKAELYAAPRVARARGQLLATLGYVRRRADLMVPIVLVFIIGTFGFNFQVTTALLAKQVFHRSAAGYGLLSTALAIGACAGALLATLRRHRASNLYLVGISVGFGVLEMLSGMMPGFAITGLVLIPTGLAMLSFSTAANTAVQMGVDPTMRGRVMALYLMAFMGGTPIGAPLIGWTANHFGPRWGMIGGGLLCVVGAVLVAVAIARRRQLHVADVVERVEHRLSGVSRPA